MPTGTKAGSAAPWLNWFGRGARAGLAKTASPKCSVRWCPTRCVAWFQYLTLVLVWLPHGPRGPNGDTAAYDRCKSPGHAPVLSCGLQVSTCQLGVGLWRLPFPRLGGRAASQPAPFLDWGGLLWLCWWLGGGSTTPQNRTEQPPNGQVPHCTDGRGLSVRARRTEGET